MKNKIKLFALPFLFTLTLIISHSSCRKETTQPANTTTPASNTITPTTNTTTPTNGNIVTGTLMFHLHTYIDEQEVDGYNIAYTTDAGRQISLSLAQMYISDIQLEKPDGTFYYVIDKKILKILDAEAYLIGNVPVGNYKSVKFKIGLPSSTNSENPSSSPDSLILNHPEMWFSNTAQPNGYTFLKVQGTIDTSADMSGKMYPFTYKIGTNINYTQITMPVQNFTIVANQVQYVHMIIDYSHLFSGISLDSTHLNINTVSDNSLPLATKIVNNIPTMFRYEY
jgi:hypothetical protein